MSVTVHAQLRCPHCGVTSRIPVYRSLHVTRAPEVRSAILARGFHRFPCQSCGRIVIVEPTMLYTDFDRHHWWATFPGAALVHRDTLARKVSEGFHENMERRCAPMVREWAPHFDIRLVFGLELLRERLLAEDHRLHDGLLECLKMQIIREQHMECLDWRSLGVLDEVTADSLAFCLTGPPTPDAVQVVRRVVVTRGRYDRLAARRTELAAAFPDLFEGSVVDWRAALAPAAAAC
jgi:hypothetical protein